VGDGGPGKGARAIVAGVNRTGGRGYDLYVPKGSAGVVWDRLIKSGARPVGLRAMETLRIEAGIPRYGVDMNEETIPLEAGLDHAVNYDKGCYVGQEVVARIHWRGHVNWVLSGFLLAGRELPSPGSELRDGNKKVGYITSSAYSPSLDRVIALGYIRRELSEPGSEAVLNTEDGGIAELAKTPFVQP